MKLGFFFDFVDVGEADAAGETDLGDADGVRGFFVNDRSGVEGGVTGSHGRGLRK